MKKRTTVLLTMALFAVLGKVYAQAPVQPTLPQKTVNLALPTQGTSNCPTLTTGSNCIRNVPSGDAASFQSAINAATCGDTIILAAGSTYSGNFTIPATSCSGWIEIVSSAIAKLPSPGTRIEPSDAPDLAVISTPDVSPAITFLPSANHWRLMGLEITTSYMSTSGTNYNLVVAGYLPNGTNISVISQLPAYLIFDRVYIHGLPTTNTKRGIMMNTQAIGIVDSYCDEIHYNQNDSQCFASSNGSGPFLIQNNFIQAGAENIMFGGDPPTISANPSDITIVGNLFQKNLAWRTQAPPYKWVLKNLLELKNAQRVLIDGNVLQYDWVADQLFAVLIRVAQLNCPTCAVEDITFTHNLMQHVPGAISVDYSLSINDPNQATQRVLIQNNLILDSNRATWGNGEVFALGVGTAPQARDWMIDHNTAFSDYAFMVTGDSGTVQNFQFTNNIGVYGAYGIFGSGKGSGIPALSFYAPGYIYSDVVLSTATGATVPNYPPKTFFNTMAKTGFTSVTGTLPDLSGNFQLLPTSPFHNAGTDGRDVGVWDWTCLNNDSAAALAGKFVPSSGSECSLKVNPVPQPPTHLQGQVSQ